MAHPRDACAEPADEACVMSALDRRPVPERLRGMRAIPRAELLVCALVVLGCRPAPDQVGFGSNSTSVTTLPEGTTGESSSTGLGVDNSSSMTSSTEDGGGSNGVFLAIACLD